MDSGNKNLCGICGEKIENGANVTFCPDCGRIVHTLCLEGKGCNCEKKNDKVENEMNTVEKKKFVFGIGAKSAVAIVCIIAVIAVVILYDMNTVSVDDFCERGEYELAYTRADENGKQEVKAEEFAMPECAKITYRLGEVDSLKFKDVYYLANGDFTATVIVTEHSDSDKKTVKNYWLYAVDVEGEEHYANVSDTDEEKIYLTDSEEQISEKTIHNYACNLIKKVTSSEGVKLNNSAVRRINERYKNGGLKEYYFIIACT